MSNQYPDPCPHTGRRVVTGEQLIYVRPQHYEALKCAVRSSGS